ncbi:hypothetical protein H6P81_009429 [Aristolochia fimbriata]|uniref:Reverse transcriptase domain-containing protein n=1 Tax=Aristolochia fimbriata TaxID=158543 RepID=A0AAV7ELE3_ARIFI|nr:hypothetical protein H6P81_009429 [Aristolochia fimbriata]
MDGSSSYNQICMDPKDEELTAFRTPKGIFCYKVMSFGLKNASATYQRAMQHIFDHFLHKRVECYVDDLVVKTNVWSDHLLDLRAVFERLRRFQLKMNPLKCAFDVTSGKFLGFIVHHRGIGIDQSKIDAIQKMPKPRNISELKSFQGHLAYIRRFISNLARRCQLFSRLMKKDTPIKWDESCQNAFNNIKAYLTKPQVLFAPIVDRLLLLYIAVQERSVGALLAQCDEDNKERSLYYLSQMLVGDEIKYTPIKKTCLALVFACAIKGQALANFLVDRPLPAEWELIEEFPDEEIFLVEVLPPWEIYFDGAARRNGAGVAVLFMSPRKDLLPYLFVLTQNYSNNEAEYQAILLGLGMAVEMKLPQLHIYDDLALVIKQLIGEFESLCQFKMKQKKSRQTRWKSHSPSRPAKTKLEIGVSLSRTFSYMAHFQPTCESEFIFVEQRQESHGGICGAHQAGKKLHLQVKRLGYYWPSMLRYVTKMARTCRPCQLHADYIHQPSESLYPTIVSWPFEAWRMDIIGPITPKSDSDRQYIMAATVYFSKWAEAAAYREVKATTIADFI